MSGICGVWNLDGQPVERSLLASLSATLAHRGPDGEGIRVQGCMGMACQHLQVTLESIGEVQPLVDAAGTMLVFDGRLDNRAELLQTLADRGDVSAASSDAALVLAAYRVYGDKMPEQLNGDFALGLYDPNRRRFLLVRDAIGIRPLYYCRAKGVFLFASEIKALLAHPLVHTRPNDDALAALLLGGGGTGDDLEATFFEGIYSVPPAHVVSVTPDGQAARCYWDFDPACRTRYGSFPEYVDAFRHYFEQAVRRRLRSAFPVAVSVSGGPDSSALFCLAETLRRREPASFPPLSGVSYGTDDGSPADEQVFLRAIEQQYGVAISRAPLEAKGFVDGAKRGVWHVESPLIYGLWSDDDQFVGLARQTGSKVLITGLWGDQMLFSMACLIDLFPWLALGKIHAHLQEFSRWMTDVDPSYFSWKTLLGNMSRYYVRYYMPDAFQLWLRRFRTKVVETSKKPTWYTDVLRARAFKHATRPTFPTRPTTSAYFASLYREVRTSLHVLCLEWSNKDASTHGLEMAFPFFDRDLLSFLMSIPGGIQTEKGVPRALLREAMRGVLPTSIAERRWKGDFTHVVNEGTCRDYPKVVEYFRSNSLSAKWGYLRADVMQTELPKIGEEIQHSTDNSASRRIQEVFGLEMWLQTFFAAVGEASPRAI
jgi:asparagine synthase (glutamine-hydrolysing)